MPSQRAVLRLISRIAGWYAAAGGAVSLLGWIADAPRLADWFNTGVSIQPNTALASILSGAALLCFTDGRLRAAGVLAAVGTLIPASVLFQYITGIDLPTDAILMFGRQWGQALISHPGRMGAPGAVSWTLLGAALTLASRRLDRRRTLILTLAGLTLAIASLSFIGYVYGASPLYAIPTATAIAFQTSTFILAVSAGLTLSITDAGFGRLLAEDGPGGTLARRLLPALLIAPVVLGFLRLWGERLGYYDLSFGTGARTLIEIALLIALLGWSASDVDRQDRARRGVEGRLTEHESLLRTVTEESNIGLVMVNRDHRYLFANRVYCSMVRADPASIVGRHVEEVLPEAYDWRVKPKLEQALTGETVQYEVELPDQGRFITVTYLPQIDHGQVQSVIVALVDTTERRRIEDALQKSQRELQDANKRKDEFLMTLAHELRNPLAPMRTAVDALRSPGAGARNTEWLQTVVDRQTRLMTRLLDDLLDVGRVAQDKLHLRRQRLDARAVVKAAIDIARPMFESARQHLRFIASEDPIWVEADEARLEQIVANLLNNASRYSSPGSRIDVFVERSGDAAAIRVIDTGLGIPPEALGRIFEMFSQLDTSLERAQGGLGIGLHLVKRLVELHGGTVQARSQGVGHGSEFIVHLPLAAAVERPQPAASAAVDNSFTPATAAARRVLIVDDNVDAAEGLAMLLQMVGHETHVAHDGLAALEAAERVRPDIVLLDIGLPKLNGFEVCRRIRAGANGAHPVMIALTGWGQEEDRKKSKDAGFDHHLVKPVEYATLKDLLSA